MNRAKGEKENITDDIVFETELIRQIEINIDFTVGPCPIRCGEKEISNPIY